MNCEHDIKVVVSSPSTIKVNTKRTNEDAFNEEFKELSKQVDGIVVQISGIEEQHTIDIKNIETKHDEDIRNIETKHATDIEDIQTKHQDDIELLDLKKADKGTTLSSYGISDAYTQDEMDILLGNKAGKDEVYNKPYIDEKLSEIGKKVDENAVAIEDMAELEEKVSKVETAIGTVYAKVDKNATDIDGISVQVNEHEKDITDIEAALIKTEMVKNKVATIDDSVTDEQYPSATAVKSYVDDVTPTKVSELENDKGYLTEYTETDPTVPDWAKEPTKPTYTADEVGALPNTTVIPTKVSELENDSGYVVEGDLEKLAEKGSTLSEYGIKDAYTKTETDSKISDVKDGVETNYYNKEDIDIKLLQRDDNLQNTIDTYDGRLNGIDDQISEMNSEIADVKAIAKGRATGYVFDTLEDLDAWLSDEANTANLVLGDNFYIRAVDVPDYWWDGSAKQQLETQKVDLTEYVKNTDYATLTTAGVVKVDTVSTTGRGIYTKDNKLIVACAEKSEMTNKYSYNRPISPSYQDYAVSVSTHQDMSDDYDVSSLKVAANFEGSQSKLPASYEAVKGYVDTSIQQAILDSWEVAV